MSESISATMTIYYLSSPMLLPVGSAILPRAYLPSVVADMKFLVVVVVALFSTVQSRPQVASRTNVCKSSVCEDNSVVDMVTMTPALSSLAAAVGAAELVDTLASQGTAETETTSSTFILKLHCFQTESSPCLLPSTKLLRRYLILEQSLRTKKL